MNINTTVDPGSLFAKGGQGEIPADLLASSNLAIPTEAGFEGFMQSALAPEGVASLPHQSTSRREEIPAGSTPSILGGAVAPNVLNIVPQAATLGAMAPSAPAGGEVTLATAATAPSQRSLPAGKHSATSVRLDCHHDASPAAITEHQVMDAEKAQYAKPLRPEKSNASGTQLSAHSPIETSSQGFSISAPPESIATHSERNRALRESESTRPGARVWPTGEPVLEDPRPLISTARKVQRPPKAITHDPANRPEEGADISQSSLPARHTEVTKKETSPKEQPCLVNEFTAIPFPLEKGSLDFVERPESANPAFAHSCDASPLSQATPGTSPGSLNERPSAHMNAASSQFGTKLVELSSAPERSRPNLSPNRNSLSEVGGSEPPPIEASGRVLRPSRGIEWTQSPHLPVGTESELPSISTAPSAIKNPVTILAGDESWVEDFIEDSVHSAPNERPSAPMNAASSQLGTKLVELSSAPERSRPNLSPNRNSHSEVGESEPPPIEASGRVLRPSRGIEWTQSPHLPVGTKSELPSISTAPSAIKNPVTILVGDESWVEDFIEDSVHSAPKGTPIQNDPPVPANQAPDIRPAATVQLPIRASRDQRVGAISVDIRQPISSLSPKSTDEQLSGSFASPTPAELRPETHVDLESPPTRVTRHNYLEGRGNDASVDGLRHNSQTRFGSLPEPTENQDGLAKQVPDHLSAAPPAFPGRTPDKRLDPGVEISLVERGILSTGFGEVEHPRARLLPRPEPTHQHLDLPLKAFPHTKDPDHSTYPGQALGAWRPATIEHPSRAPDVPANSFSVQSYPKQPSMGSNQSIELQNPDLKSPATESATLNQRSEGESAGGAESRRPKPLEVTPKPEAGVDNRILMAPVAGLASIGLQKAIEPTVQQLGELSPTNPESPPSTTSKVVDSERIVGSPIGITAPSQHDRISTDDRSTASLSAGRNQTENKVLPERPGLGPTVAALSNESDRNAGELATPSAMPVLFSPVSPRGSAEGLASALVRPTVPRHEGSGSEGMRSWTGLAAAPQGGTSMPPSLSSTKTGILPQPVARSAEIQPVPTATIAVHAGVRNSISELSEQKKGQAAENGLAKSSESLSVLQSRGDGTRESTREQRVSEQGLKSEAISGLSIASRSVEFRAEVAPQEFSMNSTERPTLAPSSGTRPDVSGPIFDAEKIELVSDLGGATEPELNRVVRGTSTEAAHFPMHEAAPKFATPVDPDVLPVQQVISPNVRSTAQSEAQGKELPVSSGTPVAERENEMQRAANRPKFAASSKQELPDVAELAPSHIALRESHPASDPRALAGGEVALPPEEMSLQESGVVNSDSQLPPSRRWENHDRLLQLIQSEVRLLGASKSEELTIKLKPDGETEILLHLQLQDGCVEARARCDRGNFEALNSQWGQLQETLSANGVRLGSLSAPSSSETSWTNHHPEQAGSHSFSNQRQEPRRDSALQPEHETNQRSASRKLETPATPRQNSGRLLESWA